MTKWEASLAVVVLALLVLSASKLRRDPLLLRSSAARRLDPAGMDSLMARSEVRRVENDLEVDAADLR